MALYYLWPCSLAAETMQPLTMRTKHIVSRNMYKPCTDGCMQTGCISTDTSEGSHFQLVSTLKLSRSRHVSEDCNTCKLLLLTLLVLCRSADAINAGWCAMTVVHIMAWVQDAGACRDLVCGSVYCSAYTRIDVVHFHKTSIA